MDSNAVTVPRIMHNVMTIFECLNTVLDRAQKHTQHGTHTSKAWQILDSTYARHSMAENVIVSWVLYLRVIG
jgi:hypothetical protein